MVKWFNRLHMVIHFGIGVLIALVVARLTRESLADLMLFAVVGSFLPDVEHVVFYFTYGRKTDYSKRVRAYLKRGQIVKWAHFCAYNHKKLMGLYSHTWYGLGLVVAGSLVSWQYSVEYGVLFVGMVFHFGFDLVEDVIINGRINPNWKGQVLRYSWVDDETEQR